MRPDHDAVRDLGRAGVSRPSRLQGEVGLVASCTPTRPSSGATNASEMISALC